MEENKKRCRFDADFVVKEDLEEQSQQNFNINSPSNQNDDFKLEFDLDAEIDQNHLA